jgi:hypothetical protein
MSAKVPKIMDDSDNMMDVRAWRGENADFNHYLVTYYQINSKY